MGEVEALRSAFKLRGACLAGVIVGKKLEKRSEHERRGFPRGAAKATATFGQQNLSKEKAR